MMTCQKLDFVKTKQQKAMLQLMGSGFTSRSLFLSSLLLVPLAGEYVWDLCLSGDISEQH